MVSSGLRTGVEAPYRVWDREENMQSRDDGPPGCVPNGCPLGIRL